MVLSWYSAMQIPLAPHLTLTLKHICRSRSGTVYWQRRIPADLEERYGRSGNLKERIGNAKTPTLVIAEKVARLDAQHNAQWAVLRADRTLYPEDIKKDAERLLTAHGFTPDGKPTHPAALELATSKLDAKLEDYAERSPDPEEAYHEATLEDFLTPVQVAAIRIAKGEELATIQPGSLFLLSDALDVYLREHRRGREDDWVRKLRQQWARFIEFSGDMVFAEFTRDDAKAFRDHLLAIGNKTDTVRRRLKTIQAIFERAIVEAMPRHGQRDNVWEKLTIQDEGKDAEKRGSLSSDDEARLRSLCRAADNELRHMLTLQLDLGTRISEPAGLRLTDIVLDHETPHVVFHKTKERDLKTANSVRKVPLVGDALWAARRVVKLASPGQAFAFPRYCSEAGVKGDSASAAANKWMKENGVHFTTHSLRHSLETRMRAVGVPIDVQRFICGWARNEMAHNYGEPHALKIMAFWLRRTLPGAVEEPYPVPPVVPL